VEVGLYRPDGTRLKVAAAQPGSQTATVGGDVVHISPAEALHSR
jgi:hypothetical protein